MRAYFSDILTSANNHNIDKKVSLRDFMQQEKATLKKTASKPNEETGEARETAESWTAMKKKHIEVVGRERMKKLLQDEQIGYWFDEGGIPLAG